METPKTPVSCWDCANVIICKYSDSIGSLGGMVEIASARAIAQIVAGDCKNFVAVPEGK